MKEEGAVAIVHLMTVLPKVNAWHLGEKRMKPEILWLKFGNTQGIWTKPTVSQDAKIHPDHNFYVA